MDEAGQAAAYAGADFEAPHNHFIQLLKETVGGHLPGTGRAVDLGCGAADISIRFARAYPGYHIDAIDGAAAMLAEAQKALTDLPAAGRRAGLSNRITLIKARLDASCLSQQAYELDIQQQPAASSARPHVAVELHQECQGQSRGFYHGFNAAG